MKKKSKSLKLKPYNENQIKSIKMIVFFGYICFVIGAGEQLIDFVRKLVTGWTIGILGLLVPFLIVLFIEMVYFIVRLKWR
jgi:hypothetical protein